MPNRHAESQCVGVEPPAGDLWGSQARRQRREGIHVDPESGAVGREAVREALTGERVGQPLNYEIEASRCRRSSCVRKACPKLGKVAALIMPWCDTHAMTRHLAEIARQVADDAHAILIMDQAGWLIVPENITILPLPPNPRTEPG